MFQNLPNTLEKKQRDYSKSVIYKIVCKNISVSYTYIGSTTNWYNRKALHKSDYYNVSSPRHKLQIYEFIRNNGDWNNFVMILVEEFSCENKRQLDQREQYWKEIYQDNIGINRSFISSEQKIELNKQYYKENKEEIKQQKRDEYANDKSYKQKYYEEHKKEILLKAKEKYANKKEKL